MKTTIAFTCSLLFILLFAGCGKVEIPEETDENTVVITDDTEDGISDEDTNGTGEENDSDADAMEEDAGESIALATCEDEKETLSEALEVNTEALATCETERKLLAQEIQNNSGSVSDIDRYQRFVNFYLENSQLVEFPFPKCGVVSLFNGESWFGDFQDALENAAIPFGRRTIETSDLSGGCASADGGMAFFLGAEDEVQSEFHLLKYNFETKGLEEAFLVDGQCEICPSQLGKRFGPYLTLTGREGSTEVEFWYYYDSNILQQK